MGTGRLAERVKAASGGTKKHHGARYEQRLGDDDELAGERATRASGSKSKKHHRGRRYRERLRDDDEDGADDDEEAPSVEMSRGAGRPSRTGRENTSDGDGESFSVALD